MNHKEALSNLTSTQFSRRNKAFSEGWRVNTEGHKVTVSNVKTGAVHVGHREMLKSMEWSKKVRWE